MDPFTQKRIVKFVQDFRKKTGQLPTLKDFDIEGFERAQVNAAIKAKLIEEFYLTLTSGTIVKGYKVREEL